MKLSPEEKNIINIMALLNAKLDGVLTFQEFAFYLILRSHAFPHKDSGERDISMLQVHQIEEQTDYRYSKNRIRTILSHLARAGLIKPQYHVKTKDGYKVYSNIKSFDGPNGLGRKLIAFTKYKILLVPGEKELRKEALKKKKSKHK